MSKQTFPSSMKIPRLIALLLASATLAPAATLYWDPNGAAPGVGGTGAWLGADVWSDDPLGGPTLSTWNNANNDDAVFSGTSGTVTIAAGGAVARSLTFEVTDYIVQTGGLTLAGAGGGEIQVAAGTATLNSVLTSALLVEKTGAGTVVFGGNNVLSGGIRIANGRIETTSGNSSVLGTSTLSMANGTTIRAVNASTPRVAPNIGSVSDNIFIDNNATVTFDVVPTPTGSNFATTANNNFAGTATHGQGVTVVKTGVGTLRLNQGNTAFGNTTSNLWRVDQGLIEFNQNNRFGNDANDITLNGGGIQAYGNGTITLASGRTVTLNNVAGNVISSTGTTTFTLSTANQLTGTGGFTKTESGTLSISASQNFSGAASISAGTLLLSGTGAINSASGVSVAAGATFQHNGSVAMTRNLTLAEGAILSGNGLGGFTPGNLAVSGDLSDGFTTFALATTPFTKAGTLSFTLTEIAEDDYTIFSGSALGGAFTSITVNGSALASIGGGNFQGTIGGFDYTFTNTNNLLSVFTTVIPEPSSALLLTLGLGWLAWRRRH